MTRPKSGNPGYYMGAPIVFGVADESAGTVAEVVGGYKIPSPRSLFTISDSATSTALPSTCPMSTEVPGSMQVEFGYDVSTGCTLTLTREELKNLCCEVI